MNDRDLITLVKTDLRHLPSVDTILSDPRIGELTGHVRRDLVVEIVRREVEALRQALLRGKDDTEDKGIRGQEGGGSPRWRLGGRDKGARRGRGEREAIIDQIISAVEVEVRRRSSPHLRRVINATGVILHTGLGRAPLPKEAILAINAATENYCNLEIDLSTGERGSRLSHVHDLLCNLTGAEDVAVVNNNAAAVFLALNTLTLGREAIVSRGQLIEIGGSFRIPDIMARSGAIMVEVGTTNRTHLNDYKDVLSNRTGLILAVHPSNYRVMGFTAEVEIKDLVQLASETGVPLMHDLGGGVLIDLRRYGLPYEPVVRESLNAGVDVVTFSGDKILGGPQAGIIAGKKKYLQPIKQNPLMRALRCDKLTYAALEATLRLYLDESTLLERHSTLRMMTEPVDRLRARGERLMSLIDSSVRKDLSLTLVEAKAQTGSGALPLEEIPSLAISVTSHSTPAERLAAALRDHDPPVVGYVHNETMFLDLRTIRDDEVEIVARAINRASCSYMQRTLQGQR